MIKTVEILVSPSGKTTVETKGFAGGSCREAGKFLEEALGRRTVERLTAEFYQAPSLKQNSEQVA